MLLDHHLSPTGGERFSFVDFSHRQESFATALARGLAGTPKSIPSRFLYDAKGSALFERICSLPEYYVTRTELAILQARANEMAQRIGPDACLIELGSGASLKVRVLLDALDRPAAYLPIDVSGEHLFASAASLADAYRDLEVVAICADYGQDFDLPKIGASGRRVAFYPGSTIGNLEPEEAERFLARWVRRGVDMLVGVDLVKSPELLEPAYDDAQGITAAFSRNLLARANRELDADFRIDQFVHRSRWNASASRIEIGLESQIDQTVHIKGRRHAFAAGERIETEHSYKYTPDGFSALATNAGYCPVQTWTDARGLFSLHYLSARVS